MRQRLLSAGWRLVACMDHRAKGIAACATQPRSLQPITPFSRRRYSKSSCAACATAHVCTNCSICHEVCEAAADATRSARWFRRSFDLRPPSPGFGCQSSDAEVVVAASHFFMGLVIWLLTSSTHARLAWFMCWCLSAPCFGARIARLRRLWLHFWWSRL